MAGSTVVISVLADVGKFTKGFDSAASKASKFGNAFKVTAAAIGVASLAVAGFVAESIKAAGESEKIAAQTAAAIKSTGGAAGRTAKQVDQLSTSLSRMSGIDDETIKSGENLLLTFTNIRGTTFDKATKSALDMSVALGTDLKSSATQLGKALNDPIKGVTKLQKIGVTFSDEQKKQIANYVKLGDTAKAQQVILDEVNREFGGSAEAFGNTFEGSIGKVKTSFGNLQEAIGTAFLPVLTKALSTVSKKMDELADNPKFQSLLTRVSTFFSNLVDGKGPVADFVKGAKLLLEKLSPLSVIMQALDGHLPNVKGGFEGVAKAMVDKLSPELPGIVSGLSDTLDKVIPLVPQLLELAKHVLKIVPPLADLAAKILPTLIPLLSDLADGLSDVLEQSGPLGDSLSNSFGVLDQMVNLLNNGFDKKSVTEFADYARSFPGPIGEISGSMQDFILNTNRNILSFVRTSQSGLIGLAGSFITLGANVGRIASTIVSSVQGAAARVPGLLRGMGTAAVGALSNAGALLVSAGRNLVQGLINGAAGMVGKLVSTIKGLANKAIKTAKDILGIHSPSTVFRTIGRFTIQGLEKGLAGANRISTIMRSVSGQVATGFDPSFSVTPAVAGAGSASAAPQVVINFNGVVTDPVGVGREVQRVWDAYKRAGGQR